MFNLLVFKIFNDLLLYFVIKILYDVVIVLKNINIYIFKLFFNFFFGKFMYYVLLI